jgi:hypothetical protein
VAFVEDADVVFEAASGGGGEETFEGFVHGFAA